MKKINKYNYLFVTQGNYGQGWEDIDQSESRRDLVVNYRLYRDEEPGYSHRIIRRRELNPDYTDACINTILGVNHG